MPKPLSLETATPDDVTNWYWYKEDLVAFCRAHDLPTNRGKVDLKHVIQFYLHNNRDSTKTRQEFAVKETRLAKWPQTLPNNLDELIPVNFTCSELYRNFFKEHIGRHFHFTAHMIQYRKRHPNLTFRQYITEWQSEHVRRRDTTYKPVIMESTQYNQYIRDFFAANPGKSLPDAILCWKYRKAQSGDKKYTPADLLALKK
jgi:hypothetical protein